VSRPAYDVGGLAYGKAVILRLPRENGGSAVNGRKAIILISTGIDTFSKATYEDVLRAVRESAIPIYTIGLGRFIQLEANLYGPGAPFAQEGFGSACDAYQCKLPDRAIFERTPSFAGPIDFESCLHELGKRGAGTGVRDPRS
jgi:hypothetical protein